MLADPGTFCYHGQPEWRAYFRGTLGHSTLQLDDRDQSDSGGPFLWSRHASTELVGSVGLEEGPIARWTAEHDGYSRGSAVVRHRRTLELDRGAHRLVVSDVVSGGDHSACLAFHLGPHVRCQLDGRIARLSWEQRPAGATMELDGQLEWTLHRGETDPPLGWYSAGFGRKVPSITLVGRGQVGPAAELCCVILL